MKSQEICPVGHYCQDGLKFPCPARYYGGSRGLSSSDCSGLCQAGYYCPVGSVSRREHTCGSNRADQYCPQGSAQPSITSMGYYSVANNDMYEEDFQVTMLGPRPKPLVDLHLKKFALEDPIASRESLICVHLVGMEAQSNRQIHLAQVNVQLDGTVLLVRSRLLKSLVANPTYIAPQAALLL